MSRPSVQSTFSSKFAYDALGVESGEETEEELQEEPTSEAQSSEPSKPSKSAIKKAKLLARQEKRQQEKAARAAARARSAQTSPTNDTSSPTTAGPSPIEPVSSEEKKGKKGKKEKKQNGTTAPNGVEPTTQPTANGHVEAEDTDAPPEQELPADELSFAGPEVLATAKITSPPQPPAAEPAPAPPPVIPQTSKPSEVAEPQPPPPAAPSSPAEKPSQNGHVEEPAQKKDADPKEAERQKKFQSFVTRAIWTLVMIGGFITLLLMGHAYMILLVMLCQTLVYREVTALFSLREKGESPESRGRDPWSKTLNWYFFAVANYYLYGESIIYYFKHVVFSDAQLAPFATNHRMISFSLYVIGFVGFVMSLKRGYLKQQFGLFCWVHMTLLFIVVSSHFIVNNILEGMIWFWVPASLVICNDIFAYIWGITLGRTPLIKLSPKKTVEGFVGAFFSTVVFGIFWGTLFMKYNYMICPVSELGVSAFDNRVHCTPNPVFVWRDWVMPVPLSALLSTLLGRTMTTIPYAPYQIHLFFMACFASLVAPFGGFFASGFKRAFNIKDFGHSIPGHGGMTDRMDCQFLMGVFTYVYYSNLIRESHVTVGSILQTIVSGLTAQEQLELLHDLKRYLESQGIAVNV